MQHSSLKALSVADDLEVLHRSPGLPSLGLMMVDTPMTRKHKDTVVKAVSGMCDTEQGKPICTSFGFAGFAPLRPDDLATVVAAYDKK
jgi:ABC-type phosphate/phosphonate transport system substrate-binding protein